MKIVRIFITEISSIFSVQGIGIAPSIALSLGFLLSTMLAHAQNEKQVSYPVQVQIERSATSSASAAKPGEQNAEAEIRSLYENASTAQQRKSAVKNQVTETSNQSIRITEKAAPAKTTSTKAAARPLGVDQKRITIPVPIVIERNSPATEKPGLANPEIMSPAHAKKTAAQNTISQNTATNLVEPIKKVPPVVTGVVTTAERDQDELANGVSAEGLSAENTTADSESPESESPESESIPVQPPSVDPLVGAPETQSVVTAVKKVPLPMSENREAYITEFKRYIETKVAPRVPGIAIAVISEGKVKVLQAYGVKKAGGRDFIDTDTAFRLASCSKTIAGTTAGILVNDGALTWDTPVVSVLPNIQFSNPRYGNQLSLRDILAQSTGLPTHAGDNYIEEGLPFDSVVAKLKSVHFVCPPGKCYGYQNVTFSLFDGMVRNKTGKAYEQYVQEKLFNPLGMETASFGLAGLKAHDNYALPHVATRKGWHTEVITENYYRMHPAAGANASITDMARWVLAQMGNNPDVLSPAVLNSIHDKVTKNTATQSHYGAREGVTNTHYGIGWRVFDYRGDKNFLHHGGYVLGFQSQMVFNAELQIGMVALSNSNKMPTNIIFSFLDAYEDEKRGPRKMILPPVSPTKKRPSQKGR